MGLDMFACTRAGALPNAVDFPQQKTDEELHYWRKHPDLHDWMAKLYVKKGGTDSNFNCNTVQLTAADLDALEAAIKAQNLPHTDGFFFGESSSKDMADDLDFVAKARAAIAAGKAVYYTYWW